MPVLSISRCSGPLEPQQHIDGEGLLSAAKRAKVGHRPAEADQAQQALDEPGRLPQRQAEQHLHGEASLDGGIAILRLPASLTSGCRHPRHVRIEPDRQGATLLQCFVVGRPVLGLVDRRDGSAHDDQLPLWIHKMNPSRHLRNKAICRYKSIA